VQKVHTNVKDPKHTDQLLHQFSDQFSTKLFSLLC